MNGFYIYMYSAFYFKVLCGLYRKFDPFLIFFTNVASHQNETHDGSNFIDTNQMTGQVKI